MFNPGELEGEVDHSFFDSDCDNDSRQEEHKLEKFWKVEEENQAASERFPAKTSGSRNDNRPLRTEDSRESVRKVKHTKNSQTKSSRKGRDRVSSASPTSRRSESVSSSDCDNDTNFNYKRPKEALSASRVKIKESNNKCQSNEDEEEAISINLSSRKKRTVKRFIQNLSSSSTEAVADLESCSSGRSSLQSTTLPKTSDASLRPVLRSTEKGSLGPELLQTTTTDESDYSVTDVSPISSPDGGKSLFIHTKTERIDDHKEYQEESVPSTGLSIIQQEASFDQDVDESLGSSFSLESEFQDKVVIHYPGRRNRKNFSFTNDEVQRIDRENQRLLRELSRLSPGPRPESALRRNEPMTSSLPLVHFSHSAINRQRELQRIQRENLAFLKKLESVKPTPGLKRSDQLADYQRHVGYLGTPSYPICISGLNKGPSSRMRFTGSRSVSSRAALTTDSNSSPLPRTKKKSSPRPAWC